MNLADDVLKHFKEHVCDYYPDEDILDIAPINMMKRRYSQIIIANIITKGGSKQIFIKIAKPRNDTPQAFINCQKEILKEFETLKFFYAKFSPYQNCRVVRPLAYFAAFPALITEKANGRNLGDILWQYAKFFPSQYKIELLKNHCFAIGRCLHIMQNLTRQNGELFNSDTIIEEIELRLNLIMESRKVVIDKKYYRTILNFFESTLSSIPESAKQISGVHADFCPGNIILDDNNVTLLDFGTYKIGSIHHDPSRLCYQLSFLLEYHIFHSKTIVALQKAFLKGYHFRQKEGNSLFQLFLIRHALCDLLNSINKKSRYPMHKLVFYEWFWKKRFDLIIQMCSDKESLQYLQIQP